MQENLEFTKYVLADTTNYFMQVTPSKDGPSPTSVSQVVIVSKYHNYSNN